MSTKEKVYEAIKQEIESLTRQSFFVVNGGFNPRTSLETLFFEDEQLSTSPKYLASELIYELFEIFPELNDERISRKLREKGYQISSDFEIPYEKLTSEEIAEIISSHQEKAA